MSTIKTEILTKESVAEHITLAETVYSSPDAVDPAHFIWKHMQNPHGVSISSSIRSGDSILLGRFLRQKRLFFLKPNQTLDGAIITDLVVSPLARNASSLIALTRQIKPQDNAIALHTSNKISDPIYRNLFKFPIVCNLKGLGTPLFFKNILRPYLISENITNLINCLFSPWRWMLILSSKLVGGIGGIRFVTQPSDLEIEKIFCNFKEHSGGHFERSLLFNEWRFSKGPIFNGQIKWIESKGICIGYFVFKQLNLNGLNICVLMDLVIGRRLSLIEKIALKLLSVRLAINYCSDAFFTLVNINNSALEWLEGFPFIAIPDSLLPHSTPIFIHASEQVYPLENRGDVYITLADLDYF